LTDKQVSYDVLILGAGVAGCATALSLKRIRPELKICIIDRKAKHSSRSKIIRVGETIPPQTATRLRELGIWQSFEQCNFQRSYGTSAVWGGEALYHNEFIASPYGYGWHVDRDGLDRMMVEESSKAGVEFQFLTSLTDAKMEKSHQWKVDLKSKSGTKNTTARMLVDATGKKAALATRFGSVKHKYDQLIGIIRSYSAAENQLSGSGAMVESVPYGWWYSSRLSHDTTVVCLMTDADIAKSESLAHEAVFEQRLQETNYTKQRITQNQSSIHIKAAHTQILDQVVGNGWLSVGDSASSFDPLSALGIFKALNLSKFASFAILDYLKGNVQGMERYQKVVRSNYELFLAKKDDYYGKEQRFAKECFWRRRGEVLVSSV